MSSSSESARDPSTSTVADCSRRGTSPAISLAPSNQGRLELIDKHLQGTRAHQDDYMYAMNLQLLGLKSQQILHTSIHKLPVELIIYVFRLSLPAPETGLPYIEALDTLFKVCTHWATVISATNSLWAVVTSMYGPELLALSLAKLNSNCPLHILCKGPTDEEFTQILRQISPHIHRWETANIVMPLTQEGCQYFSAPAPRLRRLHLSIPSSAVSSEPDPWPFDIFNGSADRLEELKVTWGRGPWDSPILRGLKSLHLRFCRAVRVSNIIAILNHCPDLRTLIIDDTYITVDMQADPSESATMTRLENIYFDVPELEGIREDMNGFTAPNCKTFRFYFLNLVPPNTEDLILTTLVPYFPFFRRLMLEHQKMVIDISELNKFHIQCPPKTYEDDLMGFRLYISGALPDTLVAFLHRVLGEGQSRKPDVRLIIGRDWGQEGIYILDSVPSYCNVVDLCLGAYTCIES
ncbi:hypothetical protein FS837_010944 [Tulasnella sp. UAMH 9824]|nr:hypothetical protein FS837_010944 [Tulasnella sp. UAMH 9824]